MEAMDCRRQAVKKVIKWYEQECLNAIADEGGMAEKTEEQMKQDCATVNNQRSEMKAKMEEICLFPNLDWGARMEAPNDRFCTCPFSTGGNRFRTACGWNSAFTLINDDCTCNAIEMSKAGMLKHLNKNHGMEGKCIERFMKHVHDDKAELAKEDDSDDSDDSEE